MQVHLINMTIEEFQASLTASEPPAGASPLVQAIWWDARGDWDRAHGLAQDVEGADGAWVHAYLHRRENDPANARYWYRRAGRPVSREGLDAERQVLLRELIARL